MYDKIDNWVNDVSSDSLVRSLLSTGIDILIILILAGLVYFVLKIVGSLINKNAKSETVKTFCGLCIKHKIVFKTSLFILFFLILAFSFRVHYFQGTVNKLSMIMMIIMTVAIINTILDVIAEFYTTKSISKSKPIKGPIQIVKVIIIFVMVLIAISVLINQNPLVLISGIGAFTAILSLVFKDAIVGLVAGIQLTSEGLIEIGDWIRIPSQDVEGAVVDISLITVRIQTFNNTIIAVPAYTLVSTPFTNWHQTIEEHKRQVSRTIYVDASSVHLENGGASSNLTRYRQALAEKVETSNHVRKEFAMQVRTLNSKDGFGIPVEIIYTTDIVDFDEYTAYCSYISDVAYGMLEKFDLKPFQSASVVKR